MEILKKYQELKLQCIKIAEEHPGDKILLDELAEVEKMILDISKSSKQEDDRYKMLFDNAGDYIFILSLEGKILEVNLTACRKYEISYDDFIDTSIVAVDVSENQQEIMRKVDDLVRHGCTRFEAVHRSKTGKVFHVDVVAQKISWNNQPAFMNICRDITEQNILQKALNDSEVKLKKIINQISDGIIIFEKNGRIIIWNAGAENITGISKREAIGLKIFDLQYNILYGENKNKDFIKKKFDEVVALAHPEMAEKLFENEILVAGKGIRTLQAIIFPIVLEQDKYLFGSVIRDITEIKENEKQLRNLISTKDKIFSVIAHDLRTPFNSIIGFTDLLLDNLEEYDTERIRKIVQFINLSAKPTLDVLTNLLNWVNAQTGQMGFHPANCNLKSIVDEVMNILNATANIKNIEIITTIQPDLAIYADVNMLKSVLQNLLSNAIKYSNSGGRIYIVARKVADVIEMEVADEGIGIDEEKKQALFQVESHESRKGTSGEKGSGLGLILSKEFIERHGGKIKVESQPGEGSRFIFTLPLAGEVEGNPKEC